MTLEANHDNNSFNEEVVPNDQYGGPTDNLIEQKPAQQIPVESAESVSAAPVENAPPASSPQATNDNEAQKCENPQVRVKNFRLFVCIP